MRTYQQLKETCLKKGYKFFDTGDYNLNIIFERTNDVITNFFTDKLYIAYRKNGIEQVREFNATTKPGIIGSIDSPVTVDGYTGTAIIVPNQYTSAFQFINSYEEFTEYPYFRLKGKLDYYRDGNKDLKVDKSVIVKGKNYKTHFHRMSKKGVTGKPVNNWSLGCIGVEEPNMKAIIPIVEESVKLYGDIFTITILETIDFK